MKFLNTFAGCSVIENWHTKEDVIKQRTDLLTHMNELIKELNDEFYYYEMWIDLVPDEADQYDLADIANSKELFTEVVERFCEIMKIVWKDEQ